MKKKKFLIALMTSMMLIGNTLPVMAAEPVEVETSTDEDGIGSLSMEEYNEITSQIYDAFYHNLVDGIVVIGSAGPEEKRFNGTEWDDFSPYFQGVMYPDISSYRTYTKEQIDEYKDHESMWLGTYDSDTKTIKNKLEYCGYDDDFIQRILDSIGYLETYNPEHDDYTSCMDGGDAAPDSYIEIYRIDKEKPHIGTVFTQSGQSIGRTTFENHENAGIGAYKDMNLENVQMIPTKSFLFHNGQISDTYGPGLNLVVCFFHAKDIPDEKAVAYYNEHGGYIGGSDDTILYLMDEVYCFPPIKYGDEAVQAESMETEPTDPELTEIEDEQTPYTLLTFGTPIAVASITALLFFLLVNRKAKISGALVDRTDLPFKVVGNDEKPETIQDMINRLRSENNLNYMSYKERILGCGYHTILPNDTVANVICGENVLVIKHPTDKKLLKEIGIAAESKQNITIHFFSKKNNIETSVNFDFTE